MDTKKFLRRADMQHSAFRAIACAVPLLIFGGLAGCGYQVQTTSGKAYLDKYPATVVVEAEEGAGTASGAPAPAVSAVSIDEQVRRVAAVEPTLTFPARIGIARIYQGKLSPLPPEEAEAWFAAAKNLGPDYGVLVPVSPLIAELVNSQASAGSTHNGASQIRRVIEKIRLGAARQHLDAVLVYEVYGSSDRRMNPIGILNFTLIGAYMFPGEDIEAEGFASALLLDVRNGYPYGTARKVAKRETAMAPSFMASAEREDALRKAESRAAVEMIPEVEKMMRSLKLELAERRASRSGAPKPVASALAPK